MLLPKNISNFDYNRITIFHCVMVPDYDLAKQAENYLIDSL